MSETALPLTKRPRILEEQVVVTPATVQDPWCLDSVQKLSLEELAMHELALLAKDQEDFTRRSLSDDNLLFDSVQLMSNYKRSASLRIVIDVRDAILAKLSVSF